MGGIFGALCFFILYFIDPVTNLLFFTIFQLLGHVGITFLMSASTAWAIEICKTNERGKISGSLKAGEAISFGLTAIIFSQLALTYGYKIIFPITSISILLFLILPLITKEEKIKREKKKIVHQVLSEFKDKTKKLVTLLGPVISISGGVTIVAAPLFAKIILGFDVVQIGIISAAGLLLGVPSSYIGGYLVDNIGRKKTMYIAIIPSIFLFILLIFIDSILIIIPYFVIIFLGGFVTAALLAMFMDITNKEIAATHFSLLLSIANIGYFTGSTITGIIIAIIGFNGLFITLALIQIPSLLILRYINTKKSNNY